MPTHHRLLPLTLAGLGTFLFLAGAHSAAAQQYVTVGTGSFPGSGDNVFPFGAESPANQPDYAAGGEYQEIYSGAAFSGPVDITSVAFASSSRDSPTIATYDVTLGLGTTSATPQAPSTTFAANKGPDFTTVYSGTMTANLLENDTFDLVFPTAPFLYDPSAGNLLLDVVVNSPTRSQGPASFIVNNTGETGRVYQSFGTGPATADETSSLYTRFGVSSITAVPEPSALALLVLGLIPIGLRARKRRSAD